MHARIHTHTHTHTDSQTLTQTGTHNTPQQALLTMFIRVSTYLSTFSLPWYLTTEVSAVAITSTYFAFILSTSGNLVTASFMFAARQSREKSTKETLEGEGVMSRARSLLPYTSFVRNWGETN